MAKDVLDKAKVEAFRRQQERELIPPDRLDYLNKQRFAYARIYSFFDNASRRDRFEYRRMLGDDEMC